jgi:hypothetical protein
MALPFGKALLWVASLAALPAIAMAPAQAADMSPIQEALQHDFRPWQIGGGLFGRTPDSPGIQPDGSIWWESVDSPLLGKGLNKPHKWLAERCAADHGALLQALPISTSHGPATIVDPVSHAALTVSGRMLLRWSWQAQRLPMIRPDDQSLEVQSADLGLFSCMQDQTPLWHVAVTIAAHPGGEGLLAVNTGRAGEVRLSLRVVDAKLVEETAQILASEDRQRLTLQADRSARQQSANQAKIAFQRGLAVGTQTNCGMVIDIRGAVAQIQQDGTYMGATPPTHWVRIDMLAPPGTVCSVM